MACLTEVDRPSTMTKQRVFKDIEGKWKKSNYHVHNSSTNSYQGVTSGLRKVLVACANYLPYGHNDTSFVDWYDVSAGGVCFSNDEISDEQYKVTNIYTNFSWLAGIDEIIDGSTLELRTNGIVKNTGNDDMKINYVVIRNDPRNFSPKVDCVLAKIPLDTTLVVPPGQTANIIFSIKLAFPSAIPVLEYPPELEEIQTLEENDNDTN